MVFKGLNLFLLCALYVSGNTEKNSTKQSLKTGTKSRGRERRFEDNSGSLFQDGILQSEELLHKQLPQSPELGLAWDRYKDAYYVLIADMTAMLERKTFYDDEADRLNNRAYRLRTRIRYEGGDRPEYKFVGNFILHPLTGFEYFSRLRTRPYLYAIASRPAAFEAQIRDDVLAMMYIASKYSVSDTELPVGIARLRQIIEGVIQGLNNNETPVTILERSNKGTELEEALMLKLEDMLRAHGVEDVDAVLDSFGKHGMRIVRTMIIAADPKLPYKRVLGPGFMKIEPKSRGRPKTFYFTENNTGQLVKNAESNINERLPLDPALVSAWDRYKDSFYHLTEDMKAMLSRKTFYVDEADKLNNRAHRLIERIHHEGDGRIQYRYIRMQIEPPLTNFGYDVMLRVRPYLYGVSYKPEMLLTQIREDVLAMMYIASRYPVSDTDIPRDIARLKQLIEQTIQGLTTDDYSEIAQKCSNESYLLLDNIMVQLEDILKENNVADKEDVLDNIGTRGMRIRRSFIRAAGSLEDGYKAHLPLLGLVSHSTR